MTKVKGSSFRLAEEFADQAGPGAWAKVVALCTLEDRQIIESAVSVGWYELALRHRVFEAIDRALSTPHSDAIRAFGRFAAEGDLTKAHRLFLRLRDPGIVLDKAAEYWRRFYDAGSWKVQRTNTAIYGELTGISELSPLFCRFLEAYIDRMFELAGARGGPCRHPRCRCRGAASCAFEWPWKAPA